MLIFLTLLAAVALATAVHLAGMVLAARLMRVRIDIVSFGGGPTLAIFDAANMTWRLAAFPVFGHVRFVERDYDLRSGLMFDDLPRGRQIAIALSGCAACAILACLVLGPFDGLRANAASWGEFFSVLAAPFPFATAQWAGIADTVRGGGFLTLFALACAKVAGLNLLPLAPFNGGMALMILLGWRSQAAIQTRAFRIYLNACLLLFAVVLALWAIGGVVYAGWGI